MGRLGFSPSQATRAAIEAETSEGTYSPPDLIKHSPGVSKVLVKWEQTGAHSILASYNMTSVTDGSAVGDTDHVFNVNFSSANYYVAGSAQSDGVPLPKLGTFAVGTLTTLTKAMSTNTELDLVNNSMMVLGDQ